MNDIADLGSLMGGTGSFLGGASSLLDTLFGSSSSSETNTSGSQVSIYDSTLTGTKTGTEKTYLEIDEEAINKLVQDVLGGTSGLADIFSEQGSAGLYDSSVASQASGDLVSKLAGEIAKLTAKEVKEYDVTDKAVKSGRDTVKVKSTSETKNEDEGLFGGLF